MQKKSLLLLIATIICFNWFGAYAGPSPIKKRKIKKLFKHSAILNGHFTGFSLYDADNDKMIWGLNDDKYFTPASNTKLYTFYTCLKMLGDSIPALKYVVHHDSLIFWGTGDPTFLHGNVKAFHFLKNSGKKLFYAGGNYSSDFFGNGWAWDDYNDDYQAEINGLPLYGNLALIYTDSAVSLKIKPAYLKRYLEQDSSYHPNRFKVKRDFVSNLLVYPKMDPPKNFRQEVPWKTSNHLTLPLLCDTLQQDIGEINLPLPSDAPTIYDAVADTVYKHMLQPSDNFIAEQLLLVCASTRFKTLNTDSVINYSKAHFLNDLPDAPQWVDGSGLSRYNLFTPRSMVKLLCKILDQVKNDTLVYSLMPAGGITGTLKSAYKLENGKPFIWAKTGSLSNVYNQSGYLITRKGRRLVFSFMNNNYTTPTHQLRDEMARVMTFVHDNW
jgi:D-alanyl-D-alanine carboxypeptidase/D-alanyl-D-alanine-endopeptidase (penicillin-binding protein 4)